MTCRYYINWPILLLIFVYCDNNSEIVHPLDTHQPDSTFNTFSYNEATNGINLSDLINSFSTKHSIRDPEDNFEAYFFSSDPDHIEVDSEKNIYVSRGELNTISVYDSTGFYQYSIGNGGNGPGEFTDLKGFTMDKSLEKIYALDRFEIEVFTKKGEHYIYQKTIKHDLYQVYGICYLMNNIYISGFKTISKEKKSKSDFTKREILSKKVTNPITRISVENRNEIHFGYYYNSMYGFGVYDGLLSKNIIHCNSAANSVIGIQKDFSYVFGYSETGKIKWISEISDYKVARHKEFRFKQTNNPGLIQYSNTDFFHRKLPLPTVNLNEYELVQYIDQRPQEYFADFDKEEMDNSVKTILINTISGKLDYIKIPFHIAYLDNDMMISVEKNNETFQRKIYIHRKN